MNLRPIREEDHEFISKWFVGQPWNLPPVDSGLSRYGYVASDDHSEIACLSVYLTGTGYAFVDWVGMNPQREFEEHREAVTFLLDNVEALMKAIPEPRVHCLVIYTRLNWLSDTLKKTNWRKTQNFIQCTKLIRHDAENS